MNITKATAQGLRDYQEDRFVCSRGKDGLLVAVFDGHGGDGTSTRLANALPRIWKKHIAFPASLVTAIQNTFRDLHVLTSGMVQGSTMSLVFIPKPADVAYVAILGDSPVIIQTADGKIDVSPQHNARSNPAELAAAQERGAYYYGGYISCHYNGHGIQMTRVMGDCDLNQIVSREPEIYVRELNADSFVLVATDGLFDPSNENTLLAAGVMVQYIREGATAETLVNRAVSTPTHDNVTAILVRVGNKKARRKKK
jgi:serine/threonine protein phosphatase PrpC